MFYRTLAVVVVMMMLAVPTMARAALMLTVENDQLVSAWGVEVVVNGVTQVLDVEFKDGTCIGLFDGCDEAGDFYFGGNATGAAAASQALLDQVFVDGQFRAFDSDPSTTNGCENLIICNVITPFDILTQARFRGAYATNSKVNDDDLAWLSETFSTGSDFSGDKYTLAIWSRSEVTVPEPPALALLLVGLAGLGWLTRGIRRSA